MQRRAKDKQVLKWLMVVVPLALIFLCACGGDKDNKTRTPAAKKQMPAQDTKQSADDGKDAGQKEATKDAAAQRSEPDYREMSRPGVISRYDKTIRKYARRYLLDWRLVSAQIHTESRFKRTARSYRGALGLMQIMPGTAKWLEGKAGKNTPELKGVSQMLLKPEMNIHLGCYYDAMLFSRIKDAASRDDRHKMMFAAYNAGPGNLNKARRKSDAPESWEGIKEHLPGETEKYVPKIYDRYEIYKRWTVLKPY